jgi:hypothetical protein
MAFGSLWLPVLVSAVVVWVASAVLHMVVRWHRADYRSLIDEAALAPALRKAAPTPGYYVIPHCEPSRMKDPDMVRRYEEGPIALIAVLPNGQPALGKNLVQWFVFCLAVSFVTAYLARHTLLPGFPGLTVCRVAGTVAFAAYGFGYLQDSIWKGIPWSNSLRGLVDALVYGVLTGLVFLWLWPEP